jgi:glycosyltransferase involved in cell wall biosynthesis
MGVRSPISRPFFSICLPSYNGVETIQRAIDALIGQTFSDWRLTIIDDFSTDGTWELVVKEYKSHPKIQLVQNEENLGLRENLNRCLEIADGRWLGILAQDDAYRLHALETIHQQLVDRDDVVLWTHGQLIHAGDAPVALPVYTHVTEFEAVKLAELLYKRGNQFGVLSSYFLNLDAVQGKKIIFADGEMLVDVRFYLRLLMHYPDRSAIYWPDLLSYVNVDETTASSRLGKSGQGAVDLIEYIGDLACLGWRKNVLFYQVVRLIYCSFKFRRELSTRHAQASPRRSAIALLREILQPRKSNQA